jgi:hypothetical protein
MPPKEKTLQTFSSQKTPRIAAFGPSGDKKMHVLQSVFHQIPRNPMMAWN